MSIQTELARIKGAKADLQSWVEENGVTVPDGTLIDGLVELAKTVETGGGGESIIVGTFTPEEDISSITLPDVVHAYDEFFLAIFNDPKSGKITSGHFWIGIDAYYTRVARYYSSNMNAYSPQLTEAGNRISVYNGTFQAGITYRYIFTFTKELW